MPKQAKRVVVLDLVGLTPAHLENSQLTPNLNRIAAKGSVSRIKPVFPAVTGAMQATLTTGVEPNRHGIVGNGRFDRKQREVLMWEQTIAPLEGERMWETLKRLDPDSKSAVLFMQHIKYDSADFIVTPSPMHLEQGMEEWYFSNPRGLYEQIAEKQGPFKLHSFWGPLAGAASSEWISKAALHIIEHHHPTLTFVYLPNLDYQAQRFGPGSEQQRDAIMEIDQIVGQFVDSLEQMGELEDTGVVILSEYALHPVESPVYLNRILREHGWLQVIELNGKEYLDTFHSQAFAVVDHQVAHIYINNPMIVNEVKEALKKISGVDQVLDDSGKKEWSLDHSNAGELIAIAHRDAWFAYYWWNDPDVAPPYATTIDIHRKPGYDPVELFMDFKTRSIPLTPERIRGSHGVLPVTEEDLVTLIAIGPSHEVVNQSDIWHAKDIPAMIFNMLGYHS
ncbi:alkaline phosphatase family protein [Paenibacillus sp. LMG 31458]|uniref:Alkaline phosphatase family protein n=1 Tax=Paenibacillus phytorum TaxID=2654977 RepID=A0ABX1XUP5_9BACL|nr:nucleotide pyrophosphatase/phosphodiesterase family protein [Paenibacillus phytorum]NOU72267.1 alkaline phosphatase family protein [Paenibacillus phytorum]